MCEYYTLFRLFAFAIRLLEISRFQLRLPVGFFSSTHSLSIARYVFPYTLRFFRQCNGIWNRGTLIGRFDRLLPDVFRSNYVFAYGMGAFNGTVHSVCTPYVRCGWFVGFFGARTGACGLQWMSECIWMVAYEAKFCMRNKEALYGSTNDLVCKYCEYLCKFKNSIDSIGERRIFDQIHNHSTKFEKK